MKIGIVTILLGALAVAAPAANFSGKWMLATGGRGGPTILTLNQVGGEVFGTFGARASAGTGSPINQEILDGKVVGDTISFYIWTGTDVPAKQMYKGTMSGDEITFEITGGPAPRGGGAFGASGRGGGRGNGGRGAAPAGPPVARRVK